MYTGGKALIRPASFSRFDIPEKLEKELKELETQKDEEIHVISDEKVRDIEAGFLTLLHLSSLSISEENDKNIREFLRNTPREVVIEILEDLASYGLIPPIEKETQGGAKYSPRMQKLTEKGLEFKNLLTKVKQDKVISKLDRIEAQRKLQAKRDAKIALQSRISGIDTTTQFENKTFNELDDFTKELAKCENHKPSVFAERLFSEKSVTVWKNTVTNKCRKIFELHQPDTQCANVIGESRIGDMCYICGLEMRNNIRSMTPSCEHILPIMQAMFFLDLYRSSDTPTDEQMNILKLEYAWTHRCCNLTKNVTSLLETRIDEENYPTWHFNSKNTDKILRSIFGEISPNECNSVRDLVPKEQREAWILDRIEKIRTEKIAPILDYIGKKGINGGIVVMLGLKNCVNPTKIDSKFLEILASEKEGTLVVTPKKIKLEKTGTMKVKRKGGNKRTHRNKK